VIIRFSTGIRELSGLLAGNVTVAFIFSRESKEAESGHFCRFASGRSRLVFVLP